MKKFCLIPLFALLPLFAFASGGEAGGMTERMMRLAIQIGLILFAAKLGNILFEKMKLPGVLGEIMVGILIGPYALGGIPMPFLGGFEHGLFHAPESIRMSDMAVSPELYGFCSVASIVLLFVVGLETDLKLFLRYAAVGSVVGIGGVIVSFVSGDLLSVYFLPKIIPGVDFHFFHPACIFLGVMSTATSVSITARVLSEHKKMETPEGVTILAGAVIDDVLGVVMLAVGMGIARNVNSEGGIAWSIIGAGAAKTILIWLFATIASVLLARTISRGLKRFGSAIAISIMALGLAMIVSGLFEEAGLAMIIGAYVMGLALSRTDISHAIRESLHPIVTFLVPVFFTVMGMMVDVSHLISTKESAQILGLPAVLVFGTVYTLVAVLAKLLGCGLPLLICGFKPRGALRVGVGMVPRGEVALIVAGIGLSSGLLSQEVFGVAILMTLLTTLVAPPLLVKAFSGNRSGLKSGRDASEHEPPCLSYDLPGPELTTLLVSELLRIFQREGFFVHDLEMGHSRFQARKDAVIITIEHTSNSIRFICDPHEQTLAQTVITEVVAEFEQTLSALRKPCDLQGIFTKDVHHRTDKIESRLAKYLTPQLMLPELKGTDKESVIREMIERMSTLGYVTDKESTIAAVMNRELAMTTGLRHGLACPHGRTDTVSKLVCAVGISRQGIEFDSLDGQPANIIILILSPAEGGNAPYMEFIAAIRDAFDEKGREALLCAKTGPEMVAILQNR